MYRTGPVRINDLARYLGKDRQTVASTLEGLRRIGWVRKHKMDWTLSEAGARNARQRCIKYQERKQNAKKERKRNSS